MRLLIVALLVLLTLGTAAAQGYYADVTLAVQENGAVIISGVSNHPQLQPGTTHELTSKNKEYWLFNLTIPDKLDEFVIVVELPSGATLNYVSAKSTLNIISEGDHIAVKRVGSNSTIALGIQYKLGEQHSSLLPYIIGTVAILVLLVSILYVAMAKRLVRPRKETKSAITFTDGLPDRQKEILALLERSGGKLTQKQIEDSLKLPKSSISRNIDALSRKGLITKQTQGLTNTIRLVKE
jgi:uncharacterized membrane protein